MKRKELEEKQKELSIKDDLMDAQGLTSVQIVKLGENNIKSLDDLADLAGDELVEMLGEDSITEKDANAVIMMAREHWFAEEDAKEAALTAENLNAAEEADAAKAKADAEAEAGEAPEVTTGEGTAPDAGEENEAIKKESAA